MSERGALSAKLKGFTNQELAEELWYRNREKCHAAYGIIIDESVDVAIQNVYGTRKSVPKWVKEEIWNGLQDLGDILDEKAWFLLEDTVYDVLKFHGYIEEERPYSET